MGATNRFISLLNICSCLVGGHCVCPSSCSPTPSPGSKQLQILLRDYVAKWLELLLWPPRGLVCVTLLLVTQLPALWQPQLECTNSATKPQNPCSSFILTLSTPLTFHYWERPLSLLILPERSQLFADGGQKAGKALQKRLYLSGALKYRQDFCRQRWRERTFQKGAILKMRKSRAVEHGYWSQMNYLGFVNSSGSQTSVHIRLGLGACQNADSWALLQTYEHWRCCGDGRLENLRCLKSFFGWFWCRWLLTALLETLILGFYLLVQVCLAVQSSRPAALPPP